MDDLVEKAAQLFGYRSYEDACSVAHSSEVELINRHAEALAEIRSLREQVARLQAIIDSRPAINAGLPETYIKWSQSVMLTEAAQAAGVVQ
jgi:hypothetical protein